MNYLTHHEVCAALQARGDKVVRVTVDRRGPLSNADTIGSRTFARAVTDVLFA